ncbi:MAG: hypothetical protein U9Q24_04215 [Candidatus Ratteibacteria bacterium]|nr:hypothetical protein [Candidatus Ratteibacteria bacterium]
MMYDKSIKKNLVSILNRISGIIDKYFHKNKPDYFPQVNISNFSDSWNRIALAYARDKRTLSGRLPEIPIRTHPNNGEISLKVTISDKTNEWNKIALQYAQQRRQTVCNENSIKE